MSASLQEAFENDAELAALREAERGAGIGFFEPRPFARLARYHAYRSEKRPSTFIPGGIGSVPADVVEACFALADSEDRMAVLELPDRATVMLAAFVETQPAHVDDFVAMRADFTDQMAAAP